MTKEWQSYQMMQNPSFVSTSDDPGPVGLNDAEELRRLGLEISGSMGVGEVLVDYDEDLAELGFRADKT